MPNLTLTPGLDGWDGGFCDCSASDGIRLPSVWETLWSSAIQQNVGYSRVQMPLVWTRLQVRDEMCGAGLQYQHPFIWQTFLLLTVTQRGDSINLSTAILPEYIKQFSIRRGRLIAANLLHGLSDWWESHLISTCNNFLLHSNKKVNSALHLAC